MSGADVDETSVFFEKIMLPGLDCERHFKIIYIYRRFGYRGVIVQTIEGYQYIFNVLNE